MYETYERQKTVLDSAIFYTWKEGETNACILFIHGLGGDAEGTWKNLPNLIMGTTFARHADLVAYDYTTNTFIPGSPKIESLTDNLVSFCETVIEKYERVYFVSHSLGSVLTLNTILKLGAVNQRWNSKIRGHILLAPALWGSLLGWASLSQTSRQLKSGSKILKNIREQWKEYVEQYPVSSFVIFGTEDKVVKKKKEELVDLSIQLKSTERNHVSISKIDSINEVTYRTIMSCLYMFDNSNHYDSRKYIIRTVFHSLKKDWEYDDHLSEFVYIPDFKIRIVEFTEKGKGREFVENWVKKFPDKMGMKHNYAIYYLSLRIYDFSMVFCDGYRYLIPLPSSVQNLTISHSQYALGKIMEKAGMYDNLDQGLRMAGIKVE